MIVDAYKYVLDFLKLYTRDRTRAKKELDMYFYEHSDFLSAFYNHYLGISINEAKARFLENARKFNFIELENKINDVYPVILQVANKITEEMKIKPNIYLFIDSWEVNALTVITTGKKTAVGVALENVNKDNIGLILAHEICHQVFIQRILEENPEIRNYQELYEFLDLADMLLFEGLAVIYTKLVYPDRELHELIFSTKETIKCCKEHEDELLNFILNDLGNKGIETYIRHFTNKSPICPRHGHYIAYKMVNTLLEHGFSWRELCYNWKGKDLVRKYLDIVSSNG